MKKLIIISLLMCGCCSVWAQHWIGLSAAADAAYQLDDIPQTTAKLGGGGGIGLMYQYQYSHFIIETGAEAKFACNPVGVADTLLHFKMVDTKGTPFVYNGELKNRLDVSQNLSVNIPLMFGIDYDYFYGLIGAKVNINLLSRTHQTAQLATSGSYDIYYEPLDNMPNHGFHDFLTEESRGTMTYNMDFRWAAELGTAIYNSDRKAKFRIGIFAEYGALNVKKSTAGIPLLTTDVTEYLHVNMNHVYGSSYAPTGSVHNLFCGIRFSVLFSVSTVYTDRYSRYPCHCAKR